MLRSERERGGENAGIEQRRKGESRGAGSDVVLSSLSCRSLHFSLVCVFFVFSLPFPPASSDSVGSAANHWLDVCENGGSDLEDVDVFDLISENKNMVEALADYGDRKSTSIVTAKRLGEFLGNEMVKDKGQFGDDEARRGGGRPNTQCKQAQQERSLRSLSLSLSSSLCLSLTIFLSSSCCPCPLSLSSSCSSFSL